MELSEKTALLIDDLPEMRSAVRIQLADAGITKVDTARNVKEALDRMSEKHFDIIVCDYNLGQGADGQQLLELVRRRHLLSRSTVYLMITGETGYEQVATAAEYAPDDYLLKPFTSGVLKSRLERILEKKQALGSIYRHIGEHTDHDKALTACDALLASGSRYVMDVLRLKGELLLESKRYADALTLYQSVLAQRATPWATLGQARALLALGRDEEAGKVLQKSMDAYPNYVAAYDTMASLLAKSDPQAAQRIVERALQVAPSTQRQRELGALAMDNKDYPRAESAFRRAVEKDRTGFFKTHDDYAGLAKSCAEQGKISEALVAIKEMSIHFRATPELAVRQAALEAQVHIKAGNTDAAKAALDKALKLKEGGGLDPVTTLEVAQACFAAGEVDQAKAIIGEVAENHHENETVLNRAKAVFIAAGLGEEGASFVEATRKRMIKLNNDAVALARAGELDQAIAMLCEAADRLTNNAQVNINAALALLMYIQKNGTNGERVQLAHRYIEQARHANPEHAKLPEVVVHYRKLAPPDAPPLAAL